MFSRKNICFLFVFFLSVIVIALPMSHAALPKNYKGKKIFYDALSIVLNKYIVPVGNWGLFEGILCRECRRISGNLNFRSNLKTTR